MGYQMHFENLETLLKIIRTCGERRPSAPSNTQYALLFDHNSRHSNFSLKLTEFHDYPSNDRLQINREMEDMNIDIMFLYRNSSWSIDALYGPRSLRICAQHPAPLRKKGEVFLQTYFDALPQILAPDGLSYDEGNLNLDYLVAEMISV